MSSRHMQSLPTPWDTILGTRSHVRTLRVLERDREPMTVRELARRADDHLRAVQLAVSRLLETGLVRQVGTGSRSLVGWNAEHALAAPLESLFRAERERHQRVLGALAGIVRERASDARFVWMREHPEAGGPRLEIGVVAGSDVVDRLVEDLQRAVASLIESEDLLIEVHGWSPADLQMMSDAPMETPGAVHHLWGTPPGVRLARGSSVRRSHQQIDEELKDGSERLASIIRSRPELIRLAREEIASRRDAADSREAHTLREWDEVLRSMSATKLARWLVHHGEQAARLRQSMPLVFVRALQEDPEDSPELSS